MWPYRASTSDALFAPHPGKPRKSVRGIADQAEVVRNRGGSDAELLDDRTLVEDLALATVELHDPLASDTLPEVLVGCDDQHLIDPFIGVGNCGGGSQCVVGLVRHHRPDGEAGGHERFFHHRNLPQDRRVHLRAVLVAGVEVVAEAFDRVIRSHPDMRCAVGHERQCRRDHSRGRRHGMAVGMARDLTKMLPEQLVRSVDQVHAHPRTVLQRHRS